MKKRGALFLAGQLALAAGVLIHMFSRENSAASFAGGFFVGLSLVFNMAFTLGMKKEDQR